VFKELLAHLDRLRSENNVWITIPREVNRWWRERAAMRLVRSPKGWRVEGEGCERARVGYASEQDGRLVLRLDDSSPERSDAADCVAPAQTINRPRDTARDATPISL
jgi:hypothetical protein